MNWRARYIINTEAILALGNTQFKEATINILAPPFEGVGEQTRLVEILLDLNLFPTVEDAYVRAMDIVEELLDRFCLVSYSQAYIHAFVSVCKEKVKVEEEFEIVQMLYFKNRSLNEVSLQSLIFSVGEKEEAYIRLLRLGITSQSQEQKLLKYFSLLEQIATSESTENITKTCSKCGDTVDTGVKKTNNFIAGTLSKYKIDKKECQAITSYRGKIAHGGGRRNQEYFLDVDIFSARIEGPTFKEILNRTGINVENGVNVHLPGYPLNKNTFRFEKDGSLTGIEGIWKSGGLFSIIDEAKKNVVQFGVQTAPGNKPLTPDNLALPDLDVK